MNSKNKYNYTPDIETRNKNNQLVQQNKINTYMEKSYYNNITINTEKYKGIKSFENIKKEEPFKINLSRINNKEKEEIKNYNTNVSINREKEKLINNNILNIQKEIRKTYYSPNKDKINLSPLKNKKSQFQSDKKVKNNNSSIFSDGDDEKMKEKLKVKEKEKKIIKDKDKEKDIVKDKDKDKDLDKEKDKEKKIEEEDENITYRRRFQSESEKEKRMRRARRFLRDNKDKDKDKDNIINSEKENERNEDNKKEEIIKDNYKNGKTNNKINEKTTINKDKDKNVNCFSLQNLYGIKKQNKNQLYKDNKNKNDINPENKKNENKNNSYESNNNNNDNSEINNKRNNNSEILKYKKGYKMNKEEEIMKNEEETQKIKDNNIEEMWKRRRKDMIPKRLKNKTLSSKSNEIIKINEENINDENIRKTISIKSPRTKNKKKIKILEDVQIEEINTTKPVVQINISQILLTINNGLNENQNKKYKNLYIYGFDKKTNNFIQFDLRKKKFLRIKISDIEDLSDTFEKDYIYQNTLIYNTLTGVFILTGKNSDQLYYYNPINETIMKICQFRNSHNLGCLLLDEENNKILIIGGKNATSCESYSFDSNELKELPNLKFDRSNTSFIISNNKIYGFFGYSYKKGKYLFNIEYINKNTLDKWEILELNVEFKKDLLPFHLKNVSTYIYGHDPNKIMIYGGKQGRSELIVDSYYYIYNTEENNFEKVEGLCYNVIKDFKGINIWKKAELIENEDKKGFFFDKAKQFIELPDEDKIEGNNENICAIIDSECNIHLLTKNKKNINVYKFNK